MSKLTSVEKKYWSTLIISTFIFYVLTFEIAGIELFSRLGVFVLLGGIIISTGGYYCGRFHAPKEEGREPRGD